MAVWLSSPPEPSLFLLPVVQPAKGGRGELSQILAEARKTVYLPPSCPSTTGASPTVPRAQGGAGWARRGMQRGSPVHQRHEEESGPCWEAKNQEAAGWENPSAPSPPIHLSPLLFGASPTPMLVSGVDKVSGPSCTSFLEKGDILEWENVLAMNGSTKEVHLVGPGRGAFSVVAPSLSFEGPSFPSCLHLTHLSRQAGRC